MKTGTGHYLQCFLWTCASTKIFISFPVHLTSLMNKNAQFKVAVKYLNTHSFYFADVFLMFKSYSYNIIWKLRSVLYHTNSQKLYVYHLFHISPSFWQTTATTVCVCVCVCARVHVCMCARAHAHVYTQTNGDEWIKNCI
jgi:hypothetical protein